MNKLLLYITLLFSTSISIGQPFASPIRFTNYTIADGLPSNNINAVMQDSRGFTWLSTSQGLARFDGHNFKVYSHNRVDSNSMPSSSVMNCIELKNHELLFTSSNSLWMLNPFNQRQHPPPTFWKGKLFYELFLMTDNLFAIRSYDKIYFANMDFKLLDSVNNPFAPSLTGIIYSGSSNVLFSDGQKTISYSLRDRKMEAMEIPVDGFAQKSYIIKQADTLNKILYLTNYWGGFYKMSYDKPSAGYLKPIHLSLSSAGGGARDIEYDAGTVIAISDDALSILQPDRQKVVSKNIPGDDASILPADLLDIYADKNENYWVSSQNGISRFSLQQLNYQFWRLPYHSRLGYYQKYDGKIWMTSEQTGSLYVDTKSQQLHVVDSSIIHYCWGATPVNNQIYIYGVSYSYMAHPYNSKLLIYNLQTKKISAPSFLKPFYHNAELITMVYQSHNGDVWYSLNYGNGIVRQKAGSNEFTQYRNTDNPQPFTFSYVHNVAEDKNGNIYFSVNKKNEVLVWKNAAQHFEQWKMDSLFNRKDILFGPLLYHTIDNKQNLWLSYQQVGLVKYNLAAHKGKLYETEDGLPSNIVNNMVADADDNMWIPSEKGLTCLLSGTDKFINFTEQDGLPFTNFLNSHLFYDKDDSSLYFSNTGFLYKIKNYELLARKKQSSAKVFIDGMDVNNQPYFFNDDKNIQLNPEENNLQFGFTLLDIGNTISNKKYEYLLSRNNEKAAWQKLDGNVIAFTQLAPGNYILQARLLNEATNTYINSDTFHFTISTKWYNTAWFIVLCFAAGIFITWSFIRLYYQRKLEKQKALLEKEKALEAERNRIAADMHDDVGAGLSRIRYITSSLQAGNKISDEDITRIVSLSDESVEKMNEIIWSLNKGNGTLEELIYHIRSHCATLVNNANLTFTCEPPENIPAKNIGWNEGRNIYMLVKEAVNNAVKHAGAAAISLDFLFSEKLIITITDNGKGFKASSPTPLQGERGESSGNGLKNYEKRVAVLNGTYHINSTPGNGTIITFEIPL